MGLGANASLKGIRPKSGHIDQRRVAVMQRGRDGNTPLLTPPPLDDETEPRS
ncbi:hypothetical protein BZB76_2480 [Actinomadura pelletieri DSM 43383]|uniref:Uncharacterized protein n=1 Tax=Actinomadura pelletieri DSM 43383 TaxID=1120940 RepID=A0A495QUA8_9ACTN|nr:hypothetical protein BZB76_2480 [Actinomadura pelletieri DSM 43383]